MSSMGGGLWFGIDYLSDEEKRVQYMSSMGRDLLFGIDYHPD